MDEKLTSLRCRWHAPCLGNAGGRESPLTNHITPSKHIDMNTNGIIRIFFVALLSFGVITPAVAGPGPHQVYTPVRTMSAAKKIPVGSRIALSCDNGGPVT